MKRVLRSCFDPLPRFMSTKSLTGLVVMVLIGTGISVYEYVESSHLPSRPAASSPACESIREGSTAVSVSDRGSCETVNRCSAARRPSLIEQPTLDARAEHVTDSSRTDCAIPPSLFDPTTEPAGS